MKKVLISIISVVLILSSSSVAFAQNKNKDGKDKAKTEKVERTPAQMAESRFKKIQAELSLNEQQSEKVLALFMKEAEKAEKAQANGEENKPKLSAKNKELTAEMKKILDDGQFEKWMESGAKKPDSGNKGSGKKK
ncbi:MAG: hypothetical protein ACI3ZN_07030 [Candidatus Cryptobacteroides sp.]